MRREIEVKGKTLNIILFYSVAKMGRKEEENPKI